MRKTLALALIALPLFTLATACSAGSPDAAPAPSAPPSSVSSPAASSPAPSSPAATSPAPSSPAAPAAPAVQQLTLQVAGGSVTGDTGTVPVKLGQPVRLTVTSDVADEVHVHGADVSADVAAGGTVTLEFTQSAAGRFEVELEGRKRVLTRLQVS